MYDVANLKEYMKIVICHIACGEQIEERLVDTMGGTVIVTEIAPKPWGVRTCYHESKWGNF